MKKKVELQKVQRDVMLVQAKEKRMREMQHSRESEINEVMKLRADLEREK